MKELIQIIHKETCKVTQTCVGGLIPCACGEYTQRQEEGKLERCGFCGTYFKGTEYLTEEELNKTSQKVLDETPLGYCTNANQEEYEQNPHSYSS